MRGRLIDGRSSGGDGPVRTCIGCRRREAAADLLRVVADPEPRPDSTGTPVRVVLPDPRRRAAGRGAWLHPDLNCVALAERRRAYGRALRRSDQLDPVPVRQYVEATG